MPIRTPVTVLGAGSWGSALAILLARNGDHVRLWARDAELLARLAARRENRRFLPGHRFPDTIDFESDIEAAVDAAVMVVLAVPSHALRSLLVAAGFERRPPSLCACASKGFDPRGLGLPHQVFAEVCGEDAAFAVVSGPTFAAEIAAGSPAAVAVAAADPAVAEIVATHFRGAHVRAYATDDVVGVEVGGAVKNVLAIAAGIADGLGFGANTRAALVTRGLAELMRLGEALGGRRETFMGLAGLGDLVLTCTDDKSRNRRFGLALARGATVAEAERSVGQVVEGVGAARATALLAAREGVEMPIAEQVHAVIEGRQSPEEAVRDLLTRAPRAELG